MFFAMFTESPMTLGRARSSAKSLRMRAPLASRKARTAASARSGSGGLGWGFAFPGWAAGAIACAGPSSGASGPAPKVDPAKMLQPAVGPRFKDRFPAHRNPAYGLLGRPLTPEDKS